MDNSITPRKPRAEFADGYWCVSQGPYRVVHICLHKAVATFYEWRNVGFNLGMSRHG